MPQSMNQKKLLQDWIEAEKRMAGFDAEKDRAAVDCIHGILCICLALIAFFLIWQMTTPAGIEEMANIAAYIGSLL